MGKDPLVDWRGVSRREDVDKQLHAPDEAVSPEAAEEAIAFFDACREKGFQGIELAWRPPFECVADRLMRQPPQRLPGVLRACVVMGWRASDASHEEWMIRHAVDISGEVPTAEDVLRMRGAIMKVLDAIAKEA